MATEAAVETQLNWIGGDWVPAKSGKVFENRNPADTQDLVGLFPESGDEDVAAAVAAAKKAFPLLARHAGAPAGRGSLRGGRDLEARQGEARAR